MGTDIRAMVQGGPPVLGTGMGGFDSHRSDCDVREQVNPTHCECASDGIVTRTSPQRPRRRIRIVDRVRAVRSRYEAPR